MLAASDAAAPDAAAANSAAARLALAARDVDGLERRWRAQLATAQRATAAAEARPGGEATATAQFEAGRLDKLSGQLADERAQLESIAGDLARAAAAGADVGEPLRAAGMLLERIARLTPGGDAAGDAKARQYDALALAGAEDGAAYRSRDAIGGECAQDGQHDSIDRG